MQACSTPDVNLPAGEVSWASALLNIERRRLLGRGERIAAGGPCTYLVSRPFSVLTETGDRSHLSTPLAPPPCPPGPGSDDEDDDDGDGESAQAPAASWAWRTILDPRPVSRALGWAPPPTAPPAVHNAETPEMDHTEPPRIVPEMADVRVASVSAGLRHSACVTADGQVLAWGSGEHGRLGLGTTADHGVPTPVLGLRTAAAVSAGASHTLCLTDAGEVLAWGRGEDGAVGLAERADVATPTRVHLGLPAGERAAAVAAGYTHSLAVTSAGRVFAWGAGAAPILGVSHDESVRPAPVPGFGPGGAHAVAASAGDGHSLILCAGGQVWALGWAGRPGRCAECTAVRALDNERIVQVSAGARHCLALGAGGEMWAWGDGTRGELGAGADVVWADEPVRVHFPDGARIATVSAGSGRSVAVRRDGLGYAWGAGEALLPYHAGLKACHATLRTGVHNMTPRELPDMRTHLRP